MPLRVSLKKHFFARSERVKGVDFHPSEPFLLSALYDGRLQIHDYITHALIKEIEVSPLPLRTAKFIVKRQWVICGGDDCALRVFNIHTLEKVKELPNAHSDYIRHVSVHATKPLVLSSSDDMTIKLWSYEKSWFKVCTYEQHTHYVMQTQWHPRDSNLFASCSLDRTIKVWSSILTQPQSSSSSSAGGGAAQQASSSSQQGGGAGSLVTSPHFTLVGHERGVNCIEYSKNGERPYLVSGSDDCTVRVWDYQTKQCIQVLTGHTKNVCAVLFTSLAGQHMLPLLFSAGEDTQLFVWHGLTYKKETAIDLNIDRIWSLSLLDTSACSASTSAGGVGCLSSSGGGGGITGSSSVSSGGGGGLGGLVLAIGSDSGTLVLKMGKEQPVASLHSGKAVVARGFEILQVNLRLLEEEESYRDGERLPVAYKDLGHCEIFPQSISHHPNGRFIAVCGDGEYVIYTAQALRNKKFGKCVDFVWSSEGHFAIKEETGRIRLHTNFVETFNFTPPFPVENIYGGALLALKASDDSFVCFYDWEACRLVRRIDVVGVQQIYWSSSGNFVSLLTSDKIYILHHDKYAVMAANTTQAKEEEGGIEIAFDLVDQISEVAVNALWISEALLYTTGQGRIKSWCGGKVEVIHHMHAGGGGGRACNSFLLGYVAEQNRLYLIDRDLGLSACTLYAAFIDYKVAIANKDYEGAQEYLPLIPPELHDGIAKFLFSKGYKEESLALAKDDELRFDIALSLGKLEMCSELIRASQKHHMGLSSSSLLASTMARWKRLGDVALETGNLPLAASCFHECRDYHSLLLMYSSSGDVKKLLYVARKAAEAKNFTVAFLAYALTQRIDQCVDVLCEAGRYPEASFFARSYAPSRASACVEKWRASLFLSRTGGGKSRKLANSHTATTGAGGTGEEDAKRKMTTMNKQKDPISITAARQGDGISASSSCAVAGGAGGGEGETSNLSVQEEDLRGLPADPSLQPEKFGSLEDAVEAEKILRERYSRVIPAVTFPSMRHLLDFDILQEINQQGIQQVRNELLSASTLDEILQEESEEQHLHNKRFGGGRDSEKSYAYHHHPQRQGENVADLLTGGRDNSSIKRRDLEDRTSLGKDEGATGSGDGLVNGTSSSSSSMAFPSQQGGEGGVVVDVSSLDATSSGGPPPDMVYRHHHNDVGNEGREEGDDLNLSSGNGVLLPPSSSSATTVPLPHLTSSSSGESSRFLTLQNLRQHEIEGGGAGVERGSNLTASDIRSTVTERSSYSGVLSIDGGGGGGGSMMMSTSGMSGSSGGGGGGLSSSGSSSSGSGSLATGGGEGGGGGASSSHYHHPGGHSYEDGGLSPSEYSASMAVEGRVRGVGIMRGREEGGEDRYRHHQGEEEEDDQDFIDDNEEDMQANHRIQQENRHHLPPTTMVGTQQQQHHHHHRHVFDLGHPPPSQEEEEEGTYQHMSVPSSSSRPGMTHGIGGGPGGVYGSEHTARVGLASTQQHLPGSSSSSLPSSHHPPRHPTGMVDSSGGRDGSLSSPSPGDDREQIGSEYGPSSSSSKARQNVLLGSAGLVDTAPAGSSSTQGVLTPGGMMNQGAEEEEEGRRNLIQGDYHLLHQTRTGGNQAVSAGNAGAQFLQDDFVDVLPSNEGSSTSGVGGGAGEHQRAGGEREEGSEFSFSDIEP